MKEFIEKLIARLEEEKSGKLNLYCDGLNYAIRTINQLAEETIHESSSKYENALESSSGWIPCNERLPEYTDEYNVTVGVLSEFGYYEKATTLRFERIKGKEPRWIVPKEEVYKIIAWMPLPAQYKGEQK